MVLVIGVPHAAYTQDIGNPPVEATDARAWLTREIARLEQDIDDLTRFKVWQDRLIRAAQSNPGEALRQRRPMAECRSSVLAPICDDLRALFRPDNAPDTEGEVSP